jgi:deazaflavin-dependent oxidoreductase (nitroreductase family)
MQTLIIKIFSRLHVALYRLTSGRLGGRVQGLGILLLTTTGRVSGKLRTNPLGYFEYDGGYVIIASNAGSDRHPTWFYNLRAKPEVSIQVSGKRMTAHAEVTGGELRELLWKKLMEVAPGYQAYERRTTRQIPLVILRPVG